MDEFKAVNQEILEIVELWEPKLIKLNATTIIKNRNVQNRNIKQILGHLVDSASNNLHRIIHLQYQPSPLIFPDYANLGNNDRWIAIQNYQDENWKDMIQLWKYSNLHFIHVVNNIDSSKLENVWISALDQKISLKEMVHYYLKHLKLHIGEIEELLGN
jgi:hypothetical protein